MFEGENFHEIVENTEKFFADYLLALLVDTTAPNLKEKTSTNSHKISKFANIFSLKS